VDDAISVAGTGPPLSPHSQNARLSFG
jgi:hypothetical protein